MIVVVTGVLSHAWPATLLPATVVGIAVFGHGWTILRHVGAALLARLSSSVRYLRGGGLLCARRAGLRTALFRGRADPWHPRLVVAHAGELLGWVGPTVVGNLVTLWPTLLRTRIAVGAEVAAARVLPVLVCSVLVLLAPSSTLPLLLLAVRASRRANLASPPAEPVPRGRRSVRHHLPSKALTL